MRVLVVIVNLGLGGTQQAMVYLLPALRQLGVHCEVASMLPPHTVGSDLESVGVPVHRFDIGHRWNVAGAVRALWKLHRAERFEVIHGKQYFGSIYAVSTRPVLPSSCIVVSFHNHEYDYPAARPWWLETRRRLQSWELRRWADGFGALSRETAAHYERHLGLRQIAILPNAVPIEGQAPIRDRTILQREYGLSDGEQCIAVPNRLTHEKGHRYFLDALALLRAEGLAPRALLLGRGPLKDELSAQVRRLGLDRQVLLPGSEVPNTEFKRVMAAADVVCVPSVFEAFGLVPAEAMALGTPVVASATGGLIDLIEPEVSGLLVPARDPPALASALARLLRSEELRRRIGDGGKARILEHFTPNAVAVKFESFYRAALTDRRSRASVRPSGGREAESA